MSFIHFLDGIIQFMNNLPDPLHRFLIINKFFRLEPTILIFHFILQIL